MKKYLLVFTILLLMGFTQLGWGATVTTAGSGNWSSTTPGAPWVGGALPSSTDDVIIANGSTVTINQNVTVASLTVGQGTSGTLLINGTRAITVNGNITIATGGKFATGLSTTGDVTATSTNIANVASTAGIILGMSITGAGIPASATIIAFTAHTITLSAAAIATGTGVALSIGTAGSSTMSIAGNITNNGTFDMSLGGSTLLCTVTFNLAGDQTISGSTPVLTQFRGITLNKSAVGNRVVASINVTMAGSGLFILTAGTWEQTAGTLTESSGSQAIAAAGSLIISGSGNFNMAINGSIAVTGNLTVNTSGTFSLGAGANSITNLAGSTINLTAGTINIYGRLTFSIGTSTINGAVINIYQQSTNLLGATSNAFECSGTANLTFSSGSVTVVDPNGSGDDTRSGRDIKITSLGTVNLTGSTFYLGDGVSTKTCTNPGTTGTGFLFGNLSSPSPVMYNVIMRGGGIAGRNALLRTSLTVGNVLTLTSGSITLNTSNLTITSTGSITGASVSHYIITNATGGLIQSVPGTSTNVTFPVGFTDTYTPVVLNNSGTTDTFTVSVKNTFDHTASATNIVNKQWTITENTPGGSNATVTLQWNTADEGGTFVRTTPFIGRWNGTAWEQNTASYLDLTGGVYTASATGFTAFSQFGIGNDGALSGGHTWIGGSTGSWAAATSWGPTRTTPAATDVLQFIGGTTDTVTNIPAQTIAQLFVSGGTKVNLQAGVPATTLTIGGGAGTDLSVDGTSQLNINGANSMTLTVATGATGSISGSMDFSGAADKLTAVDSSGITFQSGSIFKQDTLCTGNVFGASGGTNNSVVFASGSEFIQKAGSNPFANSQPASIVAFQTGSLFSNQQTGTPSFSGRTYSNFEQDYIGSAITVTGGGTASVDNLTIKNGTFNFNMTGTSSVIKGNIAVQSGGILNFNPITSGTVSLAGTSLQTIGNAGTIAIGGAAGVSTIAITNPAGVLLSTGTLTIKNSAKVSLGSSNLTIASGATLVTDSASYIVTNGTGGLIQSVGTSAVFPVGDVAYRPVTLASVTGASPVISVKVTNANPGGTADGTTLSSISKARYWAIGLVSGALTAGTVNLTYGPDDVVTDNANLLIGTSASTNGTFISTGPTTGGGSFNGSGSITSNPIVSLGTPSYFVLANNLTGTNPLPVELSSFTSTMNGKNVQLNWATKTEVKLNKFEIDRALVSASDATVTWASVGSVQASGTTNAPRKYSFTDKDLQAGKYQYRLKMIDNDGSYKFSDVVETDITLPKSFELSQNYPNPFNPSTRINYSLPFDSRVTLEVYNIVGERMGQIVNEEQSAGYYTVNFSSSNLNKSIASGVYLYKINAVDKSTGKVFTSIKKMMLLK